jgi:hypothetical protein
LAGELRGVTAVILSSLCETRRCNEEEDKKPSHKHYSLAR